MHIHLLHAIQQHGLRSSKDTNGGYGTVNDFGSGLTAWLLKNLKRSTMNFPELLPAYAHAILSAQGHKVTYGVNRLDPNADLVLIQTSIVNYSLEIAWARRIKSETPKVRVGFFGGMSTGNPALYAETGDFVITGEAEGALLDGDVADFSGQVDGRLVKNLDELPFPVWSHLSQAGKHYGLLRTGRRGGFYPLLSSRGCPMSCAYYCTYPLVQGAAFRGRSPENVLAEIEYLQSRYGMSTVMFRDPIFSLKMGRVEQICDLIMERGIKFSWICETHPRFLNPSLIEKMARAGCIAVKLGIESGDLEVMAQAQRAAPDLEYQEEIIRSLEKQGIAVLAFYILGYFDDTQESILKTLSYAEYLNTYGAQFTIATPYPGTPWHAELNRQAELFAFDDNLEHYNQYRLVYRHPHLSGGELEALKSLAYRRYYLRSDFFLKHILKINPRR